MFKDLRLTYVDINVEWSSKVCLPGFFKHSTFWRGNLPLVSPGSDAVPTDGSTVALGLGNGPEESQAGSQSVGMIRSNSWNQIKIIPISYCEIYGRFWLSLNMDAFCIFQHFMSLDWWLPARSSWPAALEIAIRSPGCPWRCVPWCF